MSIPLTREMVTTPEGELSIEMFPGLSTVDFNARVDGMLKRAAARADRDQLESDEAALEAATYVEGYKAVVTYHATRPASTDLPDQQIRMSYTAAQLSAIKQSQDDWEQKYQARVREAERRRVTASGSQAVRNEYYW